MLYKAPYHILVFFTTTYSHFWTNLMFSVHLTPALWSLHNHSYVPLKSIYFMTSGDPSKHHQWLTSSLMSTYRLCIIASLFDYMIVGCWMYIYASYSQSIKDLALLLKIFKDYFLQKITKPNIWPYFYLLHIL